MVAEGVVRADRFGSSAPERAATEPYLLTPYGWWLRAQVSRDALPPLPGGYKVGEKVFFTGESQTVSTGDKLVNGQQGEVRGPATGATTKGKGVSVLYPGNKGNISLLLTQVRRLRAAVRCHPPPAPHTRDAAHAPLALCAAAPLASVPRRPSPHCMRSRS